MATMEELASTVVQMTGRPDQLSWAVLSLNNCIKEICRTADYPQDLYETEFLAEEFGESVQGPVIVEMPRAVDFTMPPPWEASIRKIAYLVYDDQKLTEVTPHNLMLTGCNEQDVFYRNGYNKLVLNSSKAFTTLKMGAYLLPQNIQPNSGFQHWLMDAAEEVLLTGAIAKVYKNTGDDASHDRFFQEYNIMKRAFKLDNVNSGVI